MTDSETNHYYEVCPFCEKQKLEGRIGDHIWIEHQTEIEWAARRMEHYKEDND